MIFVFAFFAAVLIYFSFQSLRGGAAYLNYFKQEIAKPTSDFAPFSTIIAPCRGLDEDLEKNLAALFRQDFPAYEIIFVVDSADDEALPVIEKAISAQGKNQAAAKIIMAGKAAGESQKVHNLRAAVKHVAAHAEVFVFVDSDARPDHNWLKNLIAPLADTQIGAATGYRWFISPAGNFASELRAVWNASIASALGAQKNKNFVWGGATAMRRAVFEKLDIKKRWRGTLSDDFTITRAMKEADLEIYFVPQALTASVENCSMRQLFEFTTRQMKITRVYAQDLWIQSFLGAGLFNLVLFWGIFNLLFYSPQTFSFRFSFFALLAIFALGTGKSWLRLKAVKLVLARDYESALKKQFLAQNMLWILTPAVFFYNCLRAAFSRKIVWRGIEYNLKSATETEVLG